MKCSGASAQRRKESSDQAPPRGAFPRLGEKAASATPARSRADTQPAISPGTRPAGKLDSMSISGRRPAEARREIFSIQPAFSAERSGRGAGGRRSSPKSSFQEAR